MLHDFPVPCFFTKGQRSTKIWPFSVPFGRQNDTWKMTCSKGARFSCCHLDRLLSCFIIFRDFYIYIYICNIRRPRPTARGSASGKRGCGQQEIQQRVGDQQQQQKPLQQQEEKVAKIHSSSKRKKQPKSSFSMRFR